MKRILIVFLVCILASDLELHAQSDSIVSASGEIGGRNGWRGELTVDSYTVWEEDETYFIRLNQFSNLQPGYTLDKVKFFWQNSGTVTDENGQHSVVNFSPEFDVVIWTGGNANWIVQESNVADLANAVYYTNDSSNFGIQVYSQHYTADGSGMQEVVLTTPYTVTGVEGEIWVGIHCCGYTCGGLADEHCDVNTPWGNFLDYYYSTSESHPGWNLHVPLYYSDDTHSQCKSSPFTLSVWVNVGGVDEVINDWAISLQDPVDNEDFPAHLTADDYIVVDESLDSIYVRFSLYNMGYDTATSDVLVDIYVVDNNGENVYYWEQKSMGVNAENPCRVDYGFRMSPIAVIGIDQFQEYNLSYPLQVCVSATPADLAVDPDMSNNIICVTYVAEHYFPNSAISPSGEIGLVNNGLEFLGETGIITQFPRLTDAGELLYYAPLVTTDSTSILSEDSSSAIAYGNILFNGWNEEIDERGFQISTAFDFSFDVQTYIVDSASLYVDCDSPCTENEFSFTFSELTAGTTYYVRAYATNASGTHHGETRQFTTAGIGYPIDGLPCSGTPTLTDVDGNTYNTVQIGEQCWMRENLKTTMYADGTPISHGNEMSTTIAYWYFPNESSYYKATYGLLYNWKAVMRDTTTISCNPSGVQGICPTGWHVPSDAEWRRMEMAAGMSQDDANNTGWRGNIAAKLSGNTGWDSSSAANAAGNLNAPDRNSTGFSALPAGDYFSIYNGFGDYAAFWSSTEGSSAGVYYRRLDYATARVGRSNTSKSYGCSVRCVRDEEEGSSVTLPTSGSYSITTCDEWIYDCGGASADYSNNSDGFITIYPGGSARVVIDQGTYNVENNYDKIYVYDGEGTNEPLLATLTGSDSISTPIGSTVGPLTIRFVSDVIVTNDGFALHVSCTNTPGVNTAVVSNITGTTAICGGNVTADGCANVTARGVCWSTSQNPTVSDSHTTDGSGTGSFTSSITGLAAGTTYYVRAYATNSAGTSYGAQRSFTTILFDSVAVVFVPDGPNCATQCIDLPFVVSSFPSGSAFSRNTDLMSVGLNIEHSYIGDINISLICPDGRSVLLMPDHNSNGFAYYFGRPCEPDGSYCSASDNVPGTGWNYYWSEDSIYAHLNGHCYDANNIGHDASSTIDSSHLAQGYPGAPDFVRGEQYYTPYQSLSDLIGCPLNGLWQIEICDTWGEDNGYVFGWGLTFDTTLLWRETVAIVSTSQATDITDTSASIGGEIVSDGGANVTARGVCWSTSQNPTTADNHTTDGNGTGSFTSSITGLSANTTYYVRAYATNSVGTAYGEQRSFTTAVDPCNPYLVGRVASTSSAIDGSDLTETIVEHTTSTDTTSQFEFFVRKNCADCDTKISLEVDLYVLDENGNESLMGNVNDYANLSFASYLDYNYTQWTPAETPSISIPGHYVSFSGLSQRLNYFKLCYADPDYSCNPVSMVTPASMAALPYYGPDYAGGGTPNLGRVHGIKVSSWRQAGTYKFVIRLVRRDDATAYALTSRDLCNENQLGGHSAALTSMVYDTLTFWVQVDTALTDGQPCPGVPTLTDADGNTYNTVQIGEQCWMKENLRTTKYADGSSISQGDSASCDVGYWYYPDNDPSNKATHGLLYNWKAVMRNSSSSSSNPSGVQGICPDGWHVPSDNEWTQLTDYVSSQSSYCCSGNTSNIAKALASTTGWNSYTGSSSDKACYPSYNSSGNNATGFSALPAGSYYGSYASFGYGAYFWSATEYSSGSAYFRCLRYTTAGVDRNDSNKTSGYSVRCLRD